MRKILVLLIGFMAFAVQSMAQDKVVTGKVTDDNGAPLSGVTIKIKGGKSLGATKADGTYSIKAPVNSILQFSSVGSTTSEMQVPANGILDMSLKAGTGENLNEVVVIGYGTAKKKDLTGSVVAISSKDFVKGALTTPEQLIGGKVAGVGITPNGGAPGSGSVIRIRGGASVGASNNPLIVIDNLPIDDNGIAGSPNALGMINPADIETFTILKDASATAIYGSRGGNGVILITTKKGKSGKAKYNFSSMTSLYTPATKIDVLTADQHRAFITGLNNPAYTTLLGTANTDWQDQIYQSALGSDNNFTVSGTTKGKMPYRVSVGFLDQNGILKTGNLRRVTAAVNLSPKFLKNNLSVDVNLRGTVSQSRFANEGAIGAAVNFDPTKPVRANSGRFGGYWEWLDGSSTTGLKSLAPLNPVGLLNQLDSRSHVERSIGNVQFDYKVPFVPGLRANLNIGYDVSKGTGTVTINDSAAMSYRRFKDASNVLHGGTNNRYRSDKSNILLESYLNYEKETGVGNFELMVGYTYQAFKTKDYFFADRTFNGTLVNSPVFPFNIPENRLVSAFGRVKYSLKNKYFISASARRDGSSRFSPQNRWGDFWAVNAGWKIKEEGFLKNVEFINELKLRGGYGTTGQQNFGTGYEWQPNYGLTSNQSQYQFGNTFLNAYTPFGYNPKQKWETCAMSNIGLDFAFAKNKISGSIEYYYRESRDLLFPTPQPAGSNFTNILTTNIGTLLNEGVELTLNTKIINKKDFTFDLGFNAAWNKNIITKISGDPNFTIPTGGISGGTGNNIQIQKEGVNRQAFFTYKQIYDKNGKPIDGLFEDRNRDGIINSDDLGVYKKPDPTIIMGLSGNLSYKKWSAGFVMRANFDNYVYNNVFSNAGVIRNITNPIGYLNNGSTEVLNSGMSGNGANYYLSDYWIQNASFLRMDNINIGFNAGDVFKNNTSLRVGVNVQNAFVITKYRGLDPEVFGGIDNNVYTRPRVFVFSVNLDF